MSIFHRLIYYNFKFLRYDPLFATCVLKISLRNHLKFKQALQIKFFNFLFVDYCFNLLFILVSRCQKSHQILYEFSIVVKAYLVESIYIFSAVWLKERLVATQLHLSSTFSYCFLSVVGLFIARANSRLTGCRLYLPIC